MRALLIAMVGLVVGAGVVFAAAFEIAVIPDQQSIVDCESGPAAWDHGEAAYDWLAGLESLTRGFLYKQVKFWSSL